MFAEFTGCATNNAFIAITLVLCILITTAQMTGFEGSLLSSASISAWAVFLCYTAVSKNPNVACNPRLGDVSKLSIGIGLVLTLLSLCWTGWSYTAEDKLTSKKDSDVEAAATAEEEAPADGKRTVTGIVTGADDDGALQEVNVNDDDLKNAKATADSVDPSKLSNSWKLNIALAAVSCWSAMLLTEWGEIQTSGHIANPNVGRVGMWVIVGSQWFVMTLYVWTLVAPRVFPGREFS